MSTIIQTIISVVVVYLIFSVVVYVAVEWISSLIQLRGKILKDAIMKLFEGTDIGRAIFNHPRYCKVNKNHVRNADE